MTDWRGKRVHKFKYTISPTYTIMWQTQEHTQGEYGAAQRCRPLYSEKLCPVVKPKLFTDFVPLFSVLLRRFAMLNLDEDAILVSAGAS